jgi:hypothetical protein
VSKVGRISLYNREIAVGRAHARKEVSVRFDAAERAWVALDEDGAEIARHRAEELAPERIESLTVSHKKSRPPEPV